MSCVSGALARFVLLIREITMYIKHVNVIRSEC